MKISILNRDYFADFSVFVWIIKEMPTSFANWGDPTVGERNVLLNSNVFERNMPMIHFHHHHHHDFPCWMAINWGIPFFGHEFYTAFEGSLEYLIMDPMTKDSNWLVGKNVDYHVHFCLVRWSWKNYYNTHTWLQFCMGPNLVDDYV